MTETMYGKLYYDTGEVKYEGHYAPSDPPSCLWHHPKERGIMYYKNGVVYREGQFQRGGLFDGKEYYPSGKPKYEGRYNLRHIGK